MLLSAMKRNKAVKGHWESWSGQGRCRYKIDNAGDNKS